MTEDEVHMRGILCPRNSQDDVERKMELIC